MLDTGFTDRLTLPPGLVADLNLPLLGSASVVLADGSTQALPMYRARLLWQGHECAVRAYAAPGDPLVGMALLRGSWLTVDVMPGGAVRIEELPG